MMYIEYMDLVYFELSSGRRLVEQELLSLDRDSRAKVFSHLDLLSEFGGQLREPHVKSLGGDLKELRTPIRPGQHRIMYYVEDGGIGVLLHSILKKTQKTPDKELTIARSRMADWKRRKL